MPNLAISTKEHLASGDIVAVRLNDGSGLIRRYFRSIENKTLLVLDNLWYQSLLFEQNYVEILGKIISITIDL